MANHRLPTLSMQARAFCKRDVLAERNEDQGGYLHRRRQLILIVSAFNAQSLVAHAGDIESDNILMNSDYMVISETWMNCANTVMINGFELRASNNTALEHRTNCPSTSSELPVRVSAIYRNLQSSTNCSEIIVNANKSCGNSVLRKHNVGDICLVDVKVEDLMLFILGAVYIHPKASAEAVKLCLYQSLLPYSENLTKLIPNSQPDLETPIVLCGDFNCDPQQNSYLVEFMRNEFGLNYVQTSPTTLGNTTIDCTFTRNINVDIMPTAPPDFFIPELKNHDVQELWFQHDGATCHTARATIDLLKDTFGDRLISRFGPVNWPPRSWDLTPLDYFLWGYVKSLVYADKPQTLDHLEDNIRRVIADIRPQMLEKVIENWTSRLDYIRASRGSHMPEIIFKI
ncbi:uncharacterized protein TNCV_829751 [Trichonephila clavipes]|nr:uncharacterized protein TNCV_829751 [Trichonephila clavipes]